MTKKSPYFEQLAPLPADGSTAPADEVAEEPKEKAPFNPWADLTPKDTTKVNVIPKPPGRNRVSLHTGRSSKNISLRGLKSLERQVVGILKIMPEASDDEVISAIHQSWKEDNVPRSHRFGDSTIRNLVKLHQTKG